MDEISTRIVDSVVFDDELGYQPRFSDYWHLETATALIGAGLLIAIIALIVSIVRRRRNQP
jgi:hypothetical protein